MIQITNTKIDNAKDIDTVNPMSTLLEYSEHYGKATGSLY